MEDNKKKPEAMTAEELERAIREHQAYVRKLIEEVQMRRLAEKKSEEND